MRSPRVEPAVRGYLRELGFVDERAGADVFWACLRARYGSGVDEIRDAVACCDRMDWEKFIARKNESLQLGLKVADWFWRDRWEVYLSWLIDARLGHPSAVLDLGCDNGVLSCFYARHWPQAEVIGLDRCPNAIARARELATRLALRNVRFEVADVNDLDVAREGHAFPLVTAVNVVGHVMPYKRLGLGTVDAPGDGHDDARHALATSLRRAVADDGALVCTTGYIHSRRLWDWASALDAAGLPPNWRESAILPGGDQALVARPGESRGVSADDALAFLLRGELPAEPVALAEGHAAEALLRALSPRHLMFAFQVDLENGRAIRHELWVTSSSSMVISYRIDDRRRVLTLHPSCRFQRLAEDLLQECGEWRLAGCRVRSGEGK